MHNPDQPKRLVLYADDDPDDLQFVRESFAEHAPDIRLLSFNSAIDMLRYLEDEKKNTHPCLIILDINMPGMNGKEALKVLRTMNRYEEIPVVLFTTSTAPHDAGFAKQYGAAFISKPLSERQMNEITDQFMDHCNETVAKNGD